MSLRLRCSAFRGTAGAGSLAIGVESHAGVVRIVVARKSPPGLPAGFERREDRPDAGRGKALGESDDHTPLHAIRNDAGHRFASSDIDSQLIRVESSVVEVMPLDVQFQ